MSTLDWPYGRLQCSVQLGCLFRNQIAADGRRKMEKVCYEVGLHDQIPFGAASARLEINIDRDGEWERVKAVSIVAADCGKDARSQLPEYQ
jgi:hypothetical protein